MKQAVRLNAAHALGTVDGNGLRAGALADAFDSEEDEWVRRYARAELAAAGKRHATDAVPLKGVGFQLKQAALTDPNRYVQAKSRTFFLAAAHGHFRSDVCSVRHSANAALVSANGHRQWVFSLCEYWGYQLSTAYAFKRPKQRGAFMPKITFIGAVDRADVYSKNILGDSIARRLSGCRNRSVRHRRNAPKGVGGRHAGAQ